MSKTRKESDGRAGSEPLSPEEKEELLVWSPTWYQQPVHSQVEYQLRRAFAGLESTIIVGPRGVGKSMTVIAAMKRIVAEDVERVAGQRPVSDPDLVLERQGRLPSYARAITYYETAKAAGRKTVLRDLLRRLKARLPRGAQRTWTDTEFVERTIRELRERRSHTVCIDEAQEISVPNLKHLKAVWDQAKEEDYPLGMVLIGDDTLRDHMVSAELLGQRFTCEIRFLHFEALTADIELWHPHLVRLKGSMKSEEWKKVAGLINGAANGSFRRLVALLENMNGFALKMNRRVDVEIVELAVDNLAPED